MTSAASVVEPSVLPDHAAEALGELALDALMALLSANHDRVPRNLIDECASRGDRMVASLAEALPSPWAQDDEMGPWWLRLHAVMILGLIPSEDAGLLLTSFMHHMSEREDDNLQDWLAGYWPALFANKPPSVLPALRELCSDRKLDWYMRTNATDAVVATAEREGREALDSVLHWVAQIAADEHEDWDMRLCCGNTLLDFPRQSNRPLLEDLAKRQSGFGVHFSPDDIARAYAACRDKPDWRERDDPWEFYRPEAIGRRQERWAKEDAEDGERFDSPVWDSAVPYLRSAPKVGRNDPCPCGSGKKYKKCCLSSDQIS